MNEWTHAREASSWDEKVETVASCTKTYDIFIQRTILSGYVFVYELCQLRL